ncbi:jg2631 [Pararge aegeria aegeria]|uniref:Jg2631 protein n=1 Tax=Pararge aegeria aegeria TaxID=348720 RepID=A0A8S4RQ11_9NEOP|nr:jg2631 [Pararge aegeria aegeria]
MNTNDACDKEIQCDDKTPEAALNVTKKSLSTVGFQNNPENRNTRPLSLRSTQSFTGALEELRFCNNLQRLNLNNGNTVSTPRLTAVCPYGCFVRPPVTMPFRTRERNTLALLVVSPEVLHYHGYDFEPSQIAMLWKKDCRKFLWKGSKKNANKNHRHV